LILTAVGTMREAAPSKDQAEVNGLASVAMIPDRKPAQNLLVNAPKTWEVR
jgi:hypothetical protein